MPDKNFRGVDFSQPTGHGGKRARLITQELCAFTTARKKGREGRELNREMNCATQEPSGVEIVSCIAEKSFERKEGCPGRNQDKLIQVLGGSYESSFMRNLRKPKRNSVTRRAKILADLEGQSRSLPAIECDSKHACVIRPR